MDKRVIEEIEKGMEIPLTETEKEVLKIIQDRWKLGRSRYGVGISSGQQKTDLGWLDHAIEEAADLLQYLIAFKMKIIKEGRENE